jgi:N-acetylglucosamine-6-phosphate deacetylase
MKYRLLSHCAIIVPGYMAMKIVDIHTHGIGRYDTRSGKVDHILKMAALHGEAGVSAIVPTVYPDTIEKMRSDIAAIAGAMEAKKEKGSARIVGAHLEGPFLNPQRCGALDAKAFLEPTPAALSELLRDYEKVVKIITIAPELKGALKVIEQTSSMGVVVSMGHSDATYEEALKGKEAGARSVTHLFNAMRPMHHREPGLAGLGLLDDELYVELICDGAHVSVEMLRLVFRLKPAQRIIAVSDSVTGPMEKDGVLQGGGALVSSAHSVLVGIGISPQPIALALRGNAERLLWI